jgi:hypothetical protein
MSEHNTPYTGDDVYCGQVLNGAVAVLEALACRV